MKRSPLCFSYMIIRDNVVSSCKASCLPLPTTSAIGADYHSKFYINIKTHRIIDFITKVVCSHPRLLGPGFEPLAQGPTACAPQGAPTPARGRIFPSHPVHFGPAITLGRADYISRYPAIILRSW